MPPTKRNIARKPMDQSLPLLKGIAASLACQQTSGLPDRPDVSIRSKPKKDRIYPFTQSYVGPNILSGPVEVDFAISVALSSLPNAASFEVIFDKYRIRQVRVKFLPFATEAVVTSGTTAGPLYTVFDYDDATLTAISQLVQYDNLKMSPIGTFFERTFTPKVAIAAYSGAFTSFGQAPSTQWIDVASPGVIYYGLKGAVPGSTIGSTILWNTVVTLELEFSHPR